MVVSKLALALLLTLPPVAQAQSSHSVTLSWTASTDADAAYNVYRAPGACPSTPTLTGFTRINAVSVAGVTYLDTPVNIGMYCYEATATLNGAESGPSNAAPAVVLPAPPTSLKAVAS